MRYVTVRVVDSGGRPVSNERVNLYIYQFATGGGSKEKWTNSDGEAGFSLDADEFAEVSVSVNDSEKFSRGSIRGEYKVTV